MPVLGDTGSLVKLFIVHYHLRPGGIRRIIELAAPQFVAGAPQPVTRVVLAVGQAADRRWHDHFAQQLPGVPVEIVVEPSFNYLSEQHGSPKSITARLRRALDHLLAGANAENCLVWAHNLGVGRNLILTRELADACVARDLPLVAHHHDWWFDNRWARWPEMRRFGIRTLAAAARAVFPQHKRIFHAAINHADATVLARHFGDHALWLPNLTEPAPPPSAATVLTARRWLRNTLGRDDAPVWLLPCRSLRRKNIAEALLLTRWLRPEAWLVVTGAASSAEEQPYFDALDQAARTHAWRLRLGVLAGNEAGKPGVSELLAASEAVLLTSIQEGFGLPYLEAAAAQRPLIARRLPNIAPDLDRFGFRFPQSYDEILVPPNLFNWDAEHARQTRLFRAVRTSMPGRARELLALPPVLEAASPGPVPFSRLTLSAQLEVLTHPTAKSWDDCAPLNPQLATWRRRAAEARLRVTPWPRSARQWLGGAAYAGRFFSGLAAQPSASLPAFSAQTVQADFIQCKLARHNLHPLLWSTKT